MSIDPVPYSPSVETIDPDEAEEHQQLIDALMKFIDHTHEDFGHAFRSLHAKSNGLLEGVFEVLPDLDPQYAQGLFGTPASYPAIMRTSTAPGEILPDNVSTVRGIAIKVIGVPGARLPDSEAQNTQNFVLTNGRTFAVPRIKPFISELNALGATADRLVRSKQVFSALFRTMERGIEKFGTESTLLKGLGGNLNTHPLAEPVFSQAPIRYGDYIAKVGLFPSSRGLLALAEHEIDIDGRDNALREEVVDFLRANGAEWEFRVQLCTDLERMPIENAAIEWPEEESPYVAVARLTVEPQTAWSEERAVIIDDTMVFTPWHGIEAHRPLGAIMRARKPAYEASSSARSSRNGCPMHEPRAMPRFDD